jgi:hypothetical protein
VAAADGTELVLGGPRTVVDDLQDDLPWLVADGHRGAGRPGVLHRVRERLLHDAVPGELQARRHVGRLALDAERRIEPGLPGAAHEVADAGDGGRAVERVGVVAVHGPGEIAQLRERLAAGVGDEARGLARGVRVALQDAPGGARLHDDRGEVVRQHVVQLARDARPLACDRAVALVRPRLLGTHRLPRQLAGERTVRAQQAPAEPGQEREEQRGEEEVARLRDRHADEHREHGRGDPRDGAAAGVRADGVGRGDHGQDHAELAAVLLDDERDGRQRDAERERARQDRRAAARQQREHREPGAHHDERARHVVGVRDRLRLGDREQQRDEQHVARGAAEPPAAQLCDHAATSAPRSGSETSSTRRSSARPAWTWPP